MQSVTPFLWFNDKAEEAMKFYASILKNCRIVKTDRSGGTFEIDGREYIAFNGGPHFQLTPAFSLMVNCETQEEVDELWEKLSAGGEKSRCGWLEDKYGLWWQITPRILLRMLQDQDPVKAARVRDAMLQMDRIDIQRLQQAYDQA